jgi:class 3 adenylate cyclase/uncharacterized protein (DUF2267 family)
MGQVEVVVFSDLVESTALLAALGDDRMEQLRREHIADLEAAVRSGGGRLIKTLGDGSMSSFSSALGALRAAVAIQAGIQALNEAHGDIGLAARVGVAAGEPIADGEDLHGMAVVVASRLSGAAASGEVLVQDVVVALVASRDGVAWASAAEFELKGIPHPVNASRLLWRELGSPVVRPPEAREGTVVDLRLPPVLAAFAGEPLIGRDREIGMLRDATAPRPGRRAVVVLGEPGIGKTRHAAAAAAAAHASGTVVVLARCPPEPAIAFEPWVRGLGELALAGDDAWRARLAEAAGAELAALVPELDHRGDGAERAAAADAVVAEGARYRLLRGIGTALSYAAGEAPLQVILDDAQWCDPASAQVLSHLLETPPTDRLVVVATARDQELGRRHPVSRALSDLRRTGDLVELRLEGLDPQGVAELVGARLDRAVTPRLAERLRARTGGNPFFAGELVRDLEEAGALGGAEALDGAPVPGAVAELVEERLARLEPGTERLLSAAAAIGPTARVSLAARAAGMEAQEAERAVSEALSERLVDDVAAAKPTIGFPHALIREALMAQTSGAAQARLHLAIAEALKDDPDTEPAELARHLDHAIELIGTDQAVAAHRAAAAAAAIAHDHEQAASHWRAILALVPDDDLSSRGSTLLEVGEQELLSGDLIAAREVFAEAAAAGRVGDDATVLARAALGFAGGDVGFGWEVGIDDPRAFELLREAISALDSEDPRMTLRMTFRLAYLSVYTTDYEALEALAAEAERLRRELDDPEAHLLGRFTVLATRFARAERPDPLIIFGYFDELGELLPLAEECGRDDLLFRMVQWQSAVAYLNGRRKECDAAVERTAEIAARLGTPRFLWEVDIYRGTRLLDLGEREAGEALIRRAGRIVRRIRPDIHVAIELTVLLFAEWVYGDRTDDVRIAFEAIHEVSPRGFYKATLAWATAISGDHEAARRQIRELLEDDLEPMRGPDGHLPVAIGVVGYAAYETGDLETAERLRPLIEKMRPYLLVGVPVVAFGMVPDWLLGRLDLIAGRPQSAVDHFREAIDRSDLLGVPWGGAWARVGLAVALFRCGREREAALALADCEEMARRYDVRLVLREAAEARAEMEGRELTPKMARPKRARPVRALASRGGRRAVLSLIRGLDDAEIERRFSDAGRQRALARGLATGFQPAHASGFDGLIAWELQTYAIPPPPDSPWRWAIEIDSTAGRARLLEPAPLDTAVTIHIGLADWVRVIAGTQSALAAMVAGRCSVEGDVLLAARLEAMFGGR